MKLLGDNDFLKTTKQTRRFHNVPDVGSHFTYNVAKLNAKNIPVTENEFRQRQFLSSEKVGGKKRTWEDDNDDECY